MVSENWWVCFTVSLPGKIGLWSFSCSMTQQSGKLSVRKANAECAVFGTGRHILVSAEKCTRLLKAGGYKGFRQRWWGSYVTPVSSDSCLFTALYFVMGKTCSRTREPSAVSSSAPCAIEPLEPHQLDSSTVAPVWHVPVKIAHVKGIISR